LCDDEAEELAGLEALAEAWGRERHVPLRLRAYGSGEDLLMALGKGESFDVVFLDVYMGLTNGVDVARELRNYDEDCCIVFATNSRGHAIDGYGVRALQYLLKPLAKAAVDKALDQAREQLERRRDRFVLLRNKQGSYRIPLHEISYVESRARVFVIHRGDLGDLEFYGRLDDFEGELGDPRFLRCHKSYIVNLDYVRAIEGGEFILEGGEALRISMKLSEAKSRFASFLARDL
jgi:DNA-binding LytR/AlgR family response regulator